MQFSAELLEMARKQRWVPLHLCYIRYIHVTSLMLHKWRDVHKCELLAGDIKCCVIMFSVDRMNTDIRRNIFCILMTAEDFLEASDRLLRLNLKPQQEREILHVTIDCCLHEKNFNPYYAHIVQKFCHLHRRFQIAAQFAFWDRFKELGGLSPLQLAHLSK